MPYSSHWAGETATRTDLEALEDTMIIEFGTDWCPHCQAIQPALKELLEDKVEISHLKIEDGKGRPLGRSFAVKLWPNFVFLKEGQLVEQLARPSTEELKAAVALLAD